MSKRIEWIDRAKGIGIILVILGHSIFLEIFKILIYSFAIIFFLSGYVYTLNLDYNLRKYLLKKVRTLLIPAYFFTIFNILWIFVLSIVSNETFNISIFKKIIGIFIQYRGTQFSTDGWFLIVCLAMI
ncbi:hypothetical protein [uncultured Clostridium sp.]|uniref:hypothetical protein n=1 Tax=uncultured Clostridium sp. TaxID=59620 RepID=UPI0026DAB2BE|nr:hypothetical protein [uncultured Clostridium sp.]